MNGMLTATVTLSAPSASTQAGRAPDNPGKTGRSFRMSRRHFDLALSDKLLLVGSALLLIVIGLGLALSRDAEETEQRTRLSAPAAPAGAAAADTRTAPQAQQASSHSRAPDNSAPSRQSSWVF